MFKVELMAKWMMALIPVAYRRLTRFTAVGLVCGLALLTSACSEVLTNDPEEGGIIGSGIMLRGIVNETALASNTVVEVKSSDGQITEIAIDSANQYNASSLSGTGPWVLRVRPVSGLAIYGIAFEDGTRNINRFSDLGLRSWFARQFVNLDSEFDAVGRFTRLPTAEEYAASVASVFQLLDPVLNSYNVSGAETISADYVSNGEGVDAFLNRNTVLIRDNLVSFLYTDPATNTQSETRSTLTLQSGFFDNGTSAPTIPGKLRAITSVANEVILVWEPSVDDVAVLDYQILRDGALIATTPYPVYIDSDILEDKPYTYEVIAVDGAGNPSARSQPALASPSQASENIAPPAPTLLLELGTSDSSVQLLWAQASIGEVVYFNLYRGENALSPEFLLRVTSTTAIDISAQENEDYCYQVAAVNANGRESERSDALCVDAINAEPSDGGSPLPMTAWVVPDVESLDCEQQILNTQIQQGNVVISSGCYSVPSTLSIGPGATLTLTQGVVLKFGDKAKLLVPKDATLTINGTLADPVVLTGEFTLPGYWGGIEFQGSTSAGNLIRGAVVEYAGGADTEAAIIATQAASRFRMQETLVRFNRNMAINLRRIGLTIDEFRGNRITENDEAGFVSLPVLQSLAGNSDFTGNVLDVLSIARIGYTDTQISIPDIGIPISWGGVSIVCGSLSIEPGVELVLLPGSVIDVEGPFSAVGTEAKPILMQGRLANQGSWEGLRLSGRGNKAIEHVKMVHAGGASAPQGTGSIEITCTTESAATVNIDNVEIINSASWGIFIEGDGCITQIGDNNSYVDNLLGNVSLP